MKLIDIKWPVYKIGEHTRIYEDMGVTYIEHFGKTSILDNKNLKGDTLGARRMLSEDVYQTKCSIFMFSEMFEHTRKNTDSENWVFIDDSGKVFKYKKSKYVPLVWREITKTKIIGNTILLNVRCIKQTFELAKNYWTKFKDDDKLYLGLLKLDYCYVIYDISNTYKKDTVRKI